MIRPFTLLCAVGAAGSGLYLYQVKHDTEMVDHQIREVVKATSVLRERAGALKTKYTLLNEPQGLAELAALHLPGLRITQPDKWSSIAELDRRLPAVGSAGSAAPLEPESPRAGPMAAATPVTAPPQAAAASPLPDTAAKPVEAAAVRTAPRPTAPQFVSQSAPAAVAAAKPVAAAQVAARTPPAQPSRAVPPAFGQARLQTPGFAIASARPSPATPVSQVLASGGDAAARGGAGEDRPAGVPVVASALGMARTMVPSAPLAPATLYTVGTSR